MLRKFIDFCSEIRHYTRFLKTENEFRRIVFYSEDTTYYAYFEGLVDNLTKEKDQQVSYITSNRKDPLFDTNNKNLKVFYINKLLSLFIRLCKSKVLIMTMPDLETFHIKRSYHPVHHLYVFHSLVSTHMAYLEGALDHYDSILCTGTHQVKEIRKRERLKQLEAKTLIEAGYYRLERIHQAYQKYSKAHKNEDSKKTILVAPSWGKDNIIESLGEELVETLLQSGYRVIVRPHPETIRRTPGIVDGLEAKFCKHPDFELERSVSTDDSLVSSDVLICDLSGVAIEYAFGTERPVLFTGTNIKIRNLNYEELDIVPLELAIRKKIGTILPKEKLNTLPKVISDLIDNREAYRQRILKLRNKYVFHFGRSSEIGAIYIMEMARDDSESSNPL
jgi:YidC/Oxa1 family membrane protein insertase